MLYIAVGLGECPKTCACIPINWHWDQPWGVQEFLRRPVSPPGLSTFTVTAALKFNSTRRLAVIILSIVPSLLYSFPVFPKNCHANSQWSAYPTVTNFQYHCTVVSVHWPSNKFLKFGRPRYGVKLWNCEKTLSTGWNKCVQGRTLDCNLKERQQQFLHTIDDIVTLQEVAARGQVKGEQSCSDCDKSQPRSVLWRAAEFRVPPN